MDEIQPDPVKQFLGVALLAIGLLMMVLCGGCGGFFLLMFLFQGLSHPNDLPMAMIPVIVGGVPALVGVALFYWGRGVLRSLKPPPSAPPPG